MPGNFIVKASQHPFLEGEGGAARIVALPTFLTPRSKYRGKLRLLDAKGIPKPDIYYKIVSEGGAVLAAGVTDHTGRSVIVATEEPTPVTAYLGDGNWLIEESISDAGDDCGC